MQTMSMSTWNSCATMCLEFLVPVGLPMRVIVLVFCLSCAKHGKMQDKNKSSLFAVARKKSNYQWSTQTVAELAVSVALCAPFGTLKK